MSEDQGVFDTSAFGDLPLVSDAIGTKDSAGEGDVQGVLESVNSFVSDAADFATDPLGTLVGTGVEFVIDFVKPVQDAIEHVSGDKDALTKGGESFKEVADELDKLAQKLVDTVDSGLQDWDGKAADSARKKFAEFAEGVQNTGSQANNISQVLQVSAVLVEAAEGIIKGLLQDFLTWAIMTWVPALASAGPTFGASTAAAGAATTGQAAITISRTAQRVSEITRIIKQIADVIDKIKMIMDGIRIADSMTTIMSGTGDENSGKDLETAKDLKTRVDTAKYTAETVDTVTSGLDTVVGGGNAPEEGQMDPSSSGDNSGPGFDNTTSAAKQELGNAADNLQEVSQDGGFSDVPSDQTIEGQLDQFDS